MVNLKKLLRSNGFEVAHSGKSLIVVNEETQVTFQVIQLSENYYCINLVTKSISLHLFAISGTHLFFKLFTKYKFLI